MKSTMGTASALFVILGSLLPLFAQRPVRQQQPEFVKSAFVVTSPPTITIPMVT
ncbi:MAG: hypothetical protein WA741_32265 [Candidatus Sulfotelmatobacter sp.]